MDTSSIAGSLMLYKTEQTQQALSITMMKKAAEQQNQVANLLAQNALQAPLPPSKSDSSVNFSTYA